MGGGYAQADRAQDARRIGARVSEQIGLLAARVPALPAEIDLQCADVAEVLGQVGRGSVDLVIADPPWDLYREKPGVADPAGVYSCLTEDQIAAHMATAVPCGCPIWRRRGPLPVDTPIRPHVGPGATQ